MKIWLKKKKLPDFCSGVFFPVFSVKSPILSAEDESTHVWRGMAEAGEWISIVVPRPL